MLPFDDFTLCAATADLADEPAARGHADAVEFRMDLAENPTAQLRDYDGDLPLLVTNRHDGQGGEAADDEARLDALRDAVEHDAVGAIDLELDTCLDGRGRTVREAAREHGASVVVSAHDFDGTPLRQDMRGILGNALEYGDVAKLAVTAVERTDVLDLVSVTHEYDVEGERVATMAMGEAGRHSRAVCPVYGSRIGYAPVDPADATAPGQYDLATLRGLVDDLRGA
ncbi:3-dehydroquinate dehydratase-1 [Halarchaeum rubridurum]|uniref:3-dehydroquinate dehydratase n=1 Tax=Halarchaeum rubridurum TaxID=489911 RepID=A0A830FZR5_9EURY|nr:type I 3-dehydroquinate dehydratase [Halarchaeum rubridurum]MBP1955201.1 3-dehydroquinate dehydratase-1 [Halarchaeum rubridurum]GGM68194.1 3-dehydroquinase [Halarchaeum rubridurum]